MEQDVVRLAKELIAIPSVSQQSNAPISDFIQTWLEGASFAVERLEYTEADGERKVSLVAQKGRGAGGLGLFSHSDTVPGNAGEWAPFGPLVAEGRLIGRGSCDMKGPLAATMVAGAAVDAARLQKPLFIVVTADEEMGYGGAQQVTNESSLLNVGWPAYGVVAEPTGLVPVYAHKGGTQITVTAHGRAAHTSTDEGISANFLIAPFLAEMVELNRLFRTDTSFMNHEFDPPTNGFNMVFDDGGCRPNVTAARTTCTLSIRSMTNDRHQDAMDMVFARARHYGLETTFYSNPPFYIERDAAIVQAAIQATGVATPETVPYGTEASVYQDRLRAVILGPGHIAQAHTVGEWIDVTELVRAVDVYRRLIEMFCM